jgi:hypothetical protein
LGENNAQEPPLLDARLIVSGLGTNTPITNGYKQASSSSLPSDQFQRFRALSASASVFIRSLSLGDVVQTIFLSNAMFYLSRVRQCASSSACSTRRHRKEPVTTAKLSHSPASARVETLFCYDLSVPLSSITHFLLSLCISLLG